MGCFKQCRKWTVLSFNCLFLLTGITLTVLGAVSINDFNEISQIIPSSYSYITATPILLIILGSIIVLVSIFGSLGVLKWNLFLLNAYTIALLIIFVLHIILSIATFLAVTNHRDFAQNINSTIDGIFQNLPKNNDSVHFVQTKLECCGTFGPEFWKTIHLAAPESCYKEDKTKFDLGCQVALYDFLIFTVRFTGTTILALSPLQVIGATLSLSLVNSIRNYERRYGKYMR